jgi:hypothetical protein
MIAAGATFQLPAAMGPLQILTLLERAFRALNIQGPTPWAVDLSET